MWRLEHATVRFGATEALDHVDLEIQAGEIAVVLGPSGCGKSTLLRVMAGLQSLDAGRFLIEDTDATRTPPHRRGIGMMFQDHALFPHRDVSGNIEFGLRMGGMAPPARRERVRELLALVGLDGFERRDVATLSGGEAQRVALARSLAPGPSLLLLDEPLGALDRARRDRLVDDLPEVLRRSGTTAVHVTHDHDEAFALADRLLVMDRGRIRRQGPPEEVFDDPVSETVARFLGHRNLVGPPGGRRVVRVDAATLDPEGELTVTVQRVRFRGDHHEIECVTDDAQALAFRLTDRVRPGDAVRLRIDPARVAELRED